MLVTLKMTTTEPGVILICSTEAPSRAEAVRKILRRQVLQETALVSIEITEVVR